jgi:hypothetical protein
MVQQDEEGKPATKGDKTCTNQDDPAIRQGLYTIDDMFIRTKGSVVPQYLLPQK